MLFLLPSALCPLPSRANDLTVDRRTLQANEVLTITLTLEGAFAEEGAVELPVENLTIVGQPWVSTEFSWINGETLRRKVYRYRARPLGAGPAAVGPLNLSAGGQAVTLARIALEILPDRTSGTNEPEQILRELLAAGRDPFFIIASVDKPTVYAGEPVVLTWTLYNAANLQQLQMSSVPKLQDFWAEEIDVRRMSPTPALVGGMVLHKTPMRRVALFPLRSGRFSIRGITLDAAVMRFDRRGAFRMFEGNIAEVSYTSAPVTIDVQPLPPGPPVDAVGDLTLNCQGRVQASGGPVVIEATVSGRGNLRAAIAPRFTQDVAGDVQVESDPVTVTEDARGVVMSRRWRYLIFPTESGTLFLPPLAMRLFDPTSGQRRQAGCSLPPIEAAVAIAPKAPDDVPAAVRRDVVKRRAMPWVAGAVLAALFAGVAAPRLKRELRLRRDVREITAGTPGEIRERIDERLGNPAALLVERSERGDAYRALRSMLDAAERDRDIAVDADAEIARRVRELLVSIRSS